MADETQPRADPAASAAPARRRRFGALLPLAIFLVLAAIFMRQLLVGGDTSRIPSALIGKPAPQVSLAPLEGLVRADGSPVPGLDADAFKGRVTIVNVWASWCAPCRAEHPLLMELAGRDDVTLVGINYKDQTANALRFLGQLGNPFAAVGVDPRGMAAIEWGVYGVPETFIVAADGTIAHKHVGPLGEASLAETFLPALERAAAASYGQ
ncbi:MAG: thiol:disulfide interchange protein CycY [Alphaproteobacteria bacterium]|nr:MAG: thiol:disulfide interchange protein CycY [Alphaproteobacteria bacterium]